MAMTASQFYGDLENPLTSHLHNWQHPECRKTQSAFLPLRKNSLTSFNYRPELYRTNPFWVFVREKERPCNVVRYADREGESMDPVILLFPVFKNPVKHKLDIFSHT